MGAGSLTTERSRCYEAFKNAATPVAVGPPAALVLQRLPRPLWASVVGREGRPAPCGPSRRNGSSGPWPNGGPFLPAKGGGELQRDPSALVQSWKMS